MAVYTEVSFEQARQFLEPLGLGQLQTMEGCKGGIENTNYFVTTNQGAYVLTLFERLTFEQLPFYLRLMKHLAQSGIPVPDPAANRDGDILHKLVDKPAAVVNRLRGKSELAPSGEHCAAVASTLANMHLAARDFAMAQPNLRGLTWWNETVPVVLPHLQPAQAELLQSELVFSNIVTHVGALLNGTPDTPARCTQMPDVVSGQNRLQNGIQIFPGSVPVYRGSVLVGALGVSGDGIDQDDMIAFLGTNNGGSRVGGLGNAPSASRSDQIVVSISGGGTARLRFVGCPFAPLLDTSEQNVCQGL